MKNIGLVDDKDKQRRAFKRKLDLNLEYNFPEWKIIDTKPFRELDDYRSWILENDISVVILDERLDEEMLSDGKPIDYFGSDLVKYLRNYFKDIPIYSITNIAISDQLKKSLSYFNLILSRSKFDDEIDNYLNLFTKSGVSFYEEYQKELGRLGELSMKIAKEDFSVSELEELQTLQTRLALPHYAEDLLTRERHLEKLEQALEKIEALSIKLSKGRNK